MAVRMTCKHPDLIVLRGKIQRFRGKKCKSNPGILKVFIGLQDNGLFFLVIVQFLYEKKNILGYGFVNVLMENKVSITYIVQALYPYTSIAVISSKKR